MTIEIEIKVQAAQLVLTNGAAGNFRASPGSEVTWKTSDPNREFRLEFFTLSLDGKDSPFGCGTTCATVSNGKPFTAKLKPRPDKGEIGAYKYSVTSGSLTLDPVVVLGDY